MTTFKTKTASEFRDDFLRSVKNSLITQVGIPNPNVSFGTDHYIFGEALGKICELASYNAIVAADAQMPDTALGEDLYRQAAIYKLSLRPAGGSSGNIVLETSNTVALVTGLQLVDPSGLRYQTSLAGIYANNAIVPIEAIDTGSSTNLAAGTVMRWISPPAFVSPTTTISSGGLTGGRNAEQDEELRQRLLAILKNPPGGGNWEQFALLAENSTVSVQKAFAYPAFDGPSTELISVTRSTTNTNKNRDVDPLVLSQTILPAIQAGTFEGVNIQLTTVQNQPTDIAFGLTLPTAPTASPPGPGGGWLDGNPFPNFSPTFSQVVSVVNTTQFRVKSTTPPSIGSKLVFIDKTNWTIIHTKVVSFSQVNPTTWDIVVDVPCTNIAANDWTFPDAVNMDVYIASVLASFNQLGPGQITNLPALLPFAFRRPLVTEGPWFSDINQSFYKNLSNSGDEVLNVTSIYASSLAPDLPSNVLNGPFILVPRNIGFYPL